MTRSITTVTLALAVLAGFAPKPAAAHEFCEPTAVECRSIVLAYINRETVRIDAAFEEIQDTPIIDALISRFKAGVPVRLFVEPRANTPKAVLDKFKAAGIPMRNKNGGDLAHWKMLIFAGQKTVEFSATNFSQNYLVPVAPYTNFTQDPLFFEDDPLIVQSFQRKYDDQWVDTVTVANYANITSLVRVYPLYPIDPSLNFVPAQNFGTRSKPLYDAETQKIDVIIYKVTENVHADGLIRAVGRGIPVRLITEPNKYRDPANVWQAYNMDRMYAAGVKIRDRAHLGFMHQKTTLLYGQKIAVFGSSNWTEASNKSQWEHNVFSTKPYFFTYMQQIFERKWNGAETKAFVPLPPDAPVYVGPANAISGQPATVVLSWQTGRWAHRADVYFGTSSNPPLFKANISAGPSATAKFTVSGLAPGVTYYWKIVSKTMAGKTAAGPTWSFATY